MLAVKLIIIFINFLDANIANCKVLSSNKAKMRLMIQEL